MGTGIAPDQVDNLSTTGIGSPQNAFGTPDAVPYTAGADVFPDIDPDQPSGDSAPAYQPAVLPTDLAALVASAQLSGTLGSAVLVQESLLFTSRLSHLGAGDFSLGGVSAPDKIGATSVVVAPGEIHCELSNVDTTNDGCLLTLTVVVSNTAATEQITLTAALGIGQIGPGEMVSINGGDLTVSGSGNVGSDLSWNSSTGVSSTAGGIFVVALTAQASWD